MAAQVVLLADAVVAALNAASLGPTFTAVRGYVPAYDLKDLATIKVTVVPRELSTVDLSRRDDYFTYVIDVAVQQVIGQGAITRDEVNAACDPLMLFVEKITDLFRGDALRTSLPARFVGLTNAPIYDPVHLDGMRLFTSLISLTFKLARAN